MTNLIIGKINSGKTRGILFNEFKKSIANKENLFILDEKEEYYKTFKKELDDNGYKVYVLNLKDTSKSNSFNPLMVPYNYYKNGNIDKAIESITELGLEIFKTDNSNIDPFWENSAADYFTALTLILFKEASIKEINLGSIQTMITLGSRNIEDTFVIKKYFNNLDINDIIYKAGSSVVYAPMETRESIISVMKQKLNTYCLREQLLNNLCGNDIDLINIESKAAIFVINKLGLNNISNIMINQLVNTNIEMTYYLDNIDNMPLILELKNMLDSKLKVYVATRNKEEFVSKYGKTIIDCFENIVENKEVTEYNEIESCNEYPIFKKNEVEYFNIEEYIKNNL